MLFSYCKRTSNNDQSQVPYRYRMSPLQTCSGFGKNPIVCSGLNFPHIANRGLPRSLIDTETKLRGQGIKYQPFCGNAREGDNIQFSVFDWLKGAPQPNLKPIPCVPTPVVQTSPERGGFLCEHSPITTRCGRSCACGLNCQCKIPSMDRNVSRPQIGSLGFQSKPVSAFRF
jgi:hypothetical protein